MPAEIVTPDKYYLFIETKLVTDYRIDVLKRENRPGKFLLKHERKKNNLASTFMNKDN